MPKVTVKLEDIRKMSPPEREKLLANLREQLRDTRFAVRSAESQNVRRIRHLRKSISKVLTLQGEARTRQTKKPQVAQPTHAINKKPA